MTYEIEMQKIIKEPYKFICDYAEKLYPYTGGYFFKILSLVPCSQIIPDLKYFSRTQRTNINVLILSPSGSGKSAICSLFARFSYNPIESKSFTPAELENKIFNNPEFTLIIEDYSTMAHDEKILKIIEGILGEEKVLDRHTTRKDIRLIVNGVGLLCGVFQDLSDKLTSGTIFRTVVLINTIDDESHSNIGKHIIDNSGIEGDYSIQEKAIIDYYKLLKEIQSGECDDKTLVPIKGYEISKEIKEKVYNQWNKLTLFYRKHAPYNYFRELSDGIRMMVSHAFLNYFNREKKDGNIVINSEDCEVALKLMRETMHIKYEILISEKLAKSIRNLNQFNQIMNNVKVSKNLKGLIHTQLKGKLF